MKMKTMSLQTKIIILAIVAVILSVSFLFYGVDMNIFEYTMQKRVPKLLIIILTGSVIAIATLLFQTITNNRVLTPSILGFDTIYMFIQTMMVFLFSKVGGLMPHPAIRFLVSVVAMLFFSTFLYTVMFRKKHDMYLLLLVGMVIGTFFSSATGFIQKIIDPHEFSLLQGKLFASFNNLQNDLLFVGVVGFLLTLPFIYDYMRELDVLSLGKDHAINLGIEYEKLTRRIFMVVSILISIATALVGPLSFLGLMVVNLAYELAKTNKHKYLMIVSILISIIALVGGQFIVEQVFNFNITLSVIINFVGGIYFVYLLLKQK